MKSPVILLVLLLVIIGAVGCVDISDLSGELKRGVELPEEFKVQDDARLQAYRLSKQITALGPFRSSFSYEEFEDWVGHLNEVIDNINSDLELEVPHIRATMALYQMLNEASEKGEEYAPVIDSYNSLYEVSEKIQKEADGNYLKPSDILYKRFYISLGVFVADAAFIQQKVGYKVAFKTTGEIARAIHLQKIAKYIGYDCYGFILSKIHWNLREWLNETWEDVKKELPHQ